VTFEIVSPITDIDFTISSPVAEVKAVQPKLSKTRANYFSFDLLFKAEPVAQVEDNKIMFELTNETRHQSKCVQFVPVTE
jgi:cell division protein FtsZ